MVRKCYFFLSLSLEEVLGFPWVDCLVDELFFEVEELEDLEPVI